MFKTLQNWLSRPANRKRQAPRSPCRLQVEALEGREVPAPVVFDLVSPIIPGTFGTISGLADTVGAVARPISEILMASDVPGTLSSIGPVETVVPGAFAIRSVEAVVPGGVPAALDALSGVSGTVLPGGAPGTLGTVSGVLSTAAPGGVPDILGTILPYR